MLLLSSMSILVFELILFEGIRDFRLSWLVRLHACRLLSTLSLIATKYIQDVYYMYINYIHHGFLNKAFFPGLTDQNHTQI